MGVFKAELVCATASYFPGGLFGLGGELYLLGRRWSLDIDELQFALFTVHQTLGD